MFIIVKYIVIEVDIVNFVNVSGDYFYVYVDEILLEGMIFEWWVVYGYYLLFKVVGLFVDGWKGFVLFNYGIEDFCFIKLVYLGVIIGVWFSCKEKIC